MTIHPVGDVDGQTDGETDITKLTVAICKFVNSPKKCFAYKSERKATGKKIEEIWEDRSRWRRWDARQ